MTKKTGDSRVSDTGTDATEVGVPRRNKEMPVSSDSSSTTVRSDVSKVWRWGNVLAPVFVAAGSIGILGTSLPAGEDANHIYVLSFLGCIPLALIGAYLPCIFWRILTATRIYEVDGRSLRVWTRGKIVKEIPRSEIVHFRMRGRVSTWSFIFSPSTWLTWPRGLVTVHGANGERRTIRLPELILWGDAVRDAQEVISRALEEGSCSCPPDPGSSA